MAFELSFAPEFFIGPYDLDGADFDKERPTSVYQAIQSISEENWAELCKDMFECSPDFVTVDAVLAKIRETDTCRDLGSPVEVYIDPEGYYTVRVYDAKESN